MTNASRPAIAIALATFGALNLAASVARAAPLDSLLAAIAAEEAAPAERVRLYVKRGNVADVYYVDRIRPGRLRVLKNPRQNGREMVIIGDKQWLRTTAGWHAGPAPVDAIAKAAPSLVTMIKDGLKNAVERNEANGTRVVEGDMSWSAPGLCKGRLRVSIDRSGLPIFLGFEGECASTPTEFRQAMSYDGGFAIEPPH
jgi:hypothetical protein